MSDTTPKEKRHLIGSTITGIALAFVAVYLIGKHILAKCHLIPPEGNMI